MCQHKDQQRLLWPLRLHKVPMTMVEQLERTITQFVLKHSFNIFAKNLPNFMQY